MAMSTSPAEIASPPTTREAGPIVLFDGHCNFCSGVVNFLLARDARGVLRFAALQSPAGKQIGRAHV